MSRRRKKYRHQEPRLAPETRREIISIFLFTLSGLAFLAIFGLAGKAGLTIDAGLTKLLGALRLLFPIALVVAGSLLLTNRPKGAPLWGITLFTVSTAAMIHLIYAPGNIGVEALKAEVGGGYLGHYIAFPLFQIFGPFATGVILSALILISLSLIFSAPLSLLVVSSHKFLRALGKAASYILNLFRRPKIHGDYMEAPVQQELEFEEHEIEGIRNQESPHQSKLDAGQAGIMEQKENSDESPLAEISPPSSVLRPPRRRIGPIALPLDLLEKNSSKPVAGDIRGRQDIIKKTLENFGLEVEMADVSVGPTVTQYTLRPAMGIKLSSITALSNDLALALAAHPIRIEAPIPGKSLVGIEVPNEQTSTVRLREVFESLEWQKRASPLTLAVGRDVSGKPYLADIARMPHLLVAGSTGSGKTVCLNTIILSLLYQMSPDDLKLLLIDPKRVELPSYNGIPHLLSPVITDVKQTVQALRFALMEMERRFEAMAGAGTRDIKSFNEGRAAEERMPYLVIIVDELADLMVAAASEVEAAIIRLAQMARAVGIHLILATQRPSVDVITGLIKANITARIAFSVASLMDSRTILDTAGAEKLLGRGDMLFMSAELSKPKRLQGVYVSDQEIRKVVDYLKRAGEPQYVEITAPQGASRDSDFSANDEDSDPLLQESKEVILQAGKASASLLQRRLKVGYARAARILDLLEDEGFIGPGEGAKPREILAP